MNVRVLIVIIVFLRAPLVLALGVTPDEECLTLLRQHLGAHTDFVDRSLKRVGDQTVELEVFIVGEGDITIAHQVFSDFPRYGSWAIRNINRKPSGGNYMLQIRKLDPDPKDRSVLTADLAFELPLFSKEFKRAFRLSSTKNGRGFTLTGEAIHGETAIVGNADGFMKVFPAENKQGRLWIYVKGRAKIKNWLVYEALPDKLLARESAERIRLVMDNYLTEEDRIKAMDQMESSPQRKKGSTGRVGVSSEPSTSIR